MRQAPLRTVWIVCAVLVAATVLVYGRGLRNGFVYDDYWLVESNPALRTPGPMVHFLGSGLFAGSRPPDDGVWAASSQQYWRPFIKLALLVQFRAFGTDAGGYHAVSLAVHAATVLLLFFWLRSRAGKGGSVLGPGIGAALFALHPARVESVSWVSGCTDLWMTFWVVLGLVLWQRGGSWTRRAALPAFALAVFAKETALVVPVCLIVDAWAAGTSWRAAGRRTLGPVLAVAAAVAMWMLVLRPGGGGVFGGVPRILASAALYLERVLWPAHPSTQIGLVGPGGRFEFNAPLLALGAVALLIVVGAAVLAWRRPAFRPWFADACWAWVPLAPVVNLVAVGYSTLIAERFLALPMLGVASLAARSLRAWWAARPAHRLPGAAAAAGVCALLGAVSARYVPELRSNDTLWRYEARVQPQNPNLRLYLARAEAAAGRLDASVAAAADAYRLSQTPDLRAWSALAWAAARVRMLEDGDQDQLVALRTFYDELATRGAATLDADGAALRAAPTSVVQGMVRTNRSVRSARAMTHARTGSVAVAEQLFEDLAREDPNAANAANVARVVALQGRWDDALARLESARRAYPSDAGLSRLADSVRRARSWAAMNAPGGAAADPVRTATARARMWLDVGSLSQARAVWSEAAAQAPTRAEVIAVGALLDALQGQPAQAIAALQSARARDGAHAAVYDAVLAEVQQVRPQQAPVQGNLNNLFR